MAFTCGHCGVLQETTSSNSASGIVKLSVGDFRGKRDLNNRTTVLGVEIYAVRCASDQCKNVSVFASIGTALLTEGASLISQSLISSFDYPPPSGQPFPVGVPAFLLQDYREAWSIINLSPKSSATLARRCLQAMIRDFCGIRERTLYQEIATLEKLLADDSLPKGVEPETIEAMRAVKDIGNIGAHMTEVDGTIVDVEPHEAETLLGLIEMLFSDWYVAREKRQARLDAIQQLAASKKEPQLPKGA